MCSHRQPRRCTMKRSPSSGDDTRMVYTTTIERTVYRFADLKELMAKATPQRSGTNWPASPPTVRSSACPRRWHWPTCR